MRQKTKSHICQYCSTSYHPHYGRADQKFCSRGCYLKHRWGDREINLCPICEKPAISTGEKTQKYCSRECYWKAKKGSKNPEISNLTTKECDVCGKDITRPVSDFHAKRYFCSKECKAEWFSEFMTGEKHPRWTGGYPHSYGIGWKKARKQAVKRAKGICQICKRHKLKAIHHRLPIRYFKKPDDAHYSENLLAVCTICHAVEHRKLLAAIPLIDLMYRSK